MFYGETPKYGGAHAFTAEWEAVEVENDDTEEGARTILLSPATRRL